MPAKCLVCLFALITALVAALTAAAATLALLPNTLLATAIPKSAAYYLIALAAATLLLAALAASVALSRRKKSCTLRVLVLLNAILFVAATGATVASFGYSNIIEEAREAGFSDASEVVDQAAAGAQKIVLDSFRDVFTRAYDTCDPVSYDASLVNLQCEAAQLLNVEGVDQCASENYPTTRAGLYCTAGPGLEPFSIDKAVEYPDPSGPIEVLRQWNFGSLVNYACMPTQAKYASALSKVQDIKNGAVANENDKFQRCYASRWWNVNEDTYSNHNFGSQPGPSLNDAETIFFGLLSPAKQQVSEKIIFCHCATDEDSKFYTVLRASAEYARWIALGFSIFFLFTLIGSISLLCSQPKPKSQFGGIRA